MPFKLGTSFVTVILPIFDAKNENKALTTGFSRHTVTITQTKTVIRFEKFAL